MPKKKSKKIKKCPHKRIPNTCHACWAHDREQETDISVASCKFNYYHICGDDCPGQVL